MAGLDTTKKRKARSKPQRGLIMYMCSTSVMNVVKFTVILYYIIVLGLILLLLVVIHCTTKNSSLLVNVIGTQKQLIVST